MLRDAHRGLEQMSTLVSAIKEERWGDAERVLNDIQRITVKLMKEVGDKARDDMATPKPDAGDRG